MQNKVDRIKTILNNTLDFLGISPTVSVTASNDCIDVQVSGDDLSFLIGYRGESLSALQTFLMLALNKGSSEWTRVVVDINAYRKQRTEKIENIARNFIDKVRFFNKEIEMPPMNSFERFQVHTFVAEYDDITSDSIGERAERRVVLRPSTPSA